MKGAKQVLLIVVLLMAALQGCATTDKKADILYQPTANVKGGAGDLYLIQDLVQPGSLATGRHWILGPVKGSDGGERGRIVTEMAPTSLVMYALNQELRRAGYNVMVTDKMPDGVKRGVSLRAASISIEQKHWVLKDEAKCSVKISLQPWRDGAATGTAGYEALYEEEAATGRDRLASTVLQKALQSLMTRAVPALVATLEPK